MTRNEDAHWSATLALPPGRYLYKVLVVYRGVLTMPGDRTVVLAGSDQWN